VENGRTHSGNAEIADQVEEYLQTKKNNDNKKKNQKGRERVKTKSRKGSEEEEEAYLIYSSFRYFFEGEGPREYD
jgi:hypothetical protein